MGCAGFFIIDTDTELDRKEIGGLLFCLFVLVNLDSVFVSLS